MTVTIGSDPEVLLRHKDGHMVSAAGMFEGTKGNPVPFADGLAWQPDNVCLEYNTDPTASKKEWLRLHTTAIEAINEHVGPQGLSVCLESAHTFNKSELQHEDSWVFGCEPDFNVWAMQTSTMGQDTDRHFRSAGGHIHIGIDCGMTQGEKVLAAMMADFTIGLHLIQFEDGNDLKRRQLYGKAGSMRFKNYGIEYRTPSNAWLRSQDLMSDVFSLAADVGSKIKRNTMDCDALINEYLRYKDKIVLALDEGNKEAAAEMRKVRII